MKKLLAAIRAARGANEPTPERERERDTEPRGAVRSIPIAVFVRIL